MRTRLSGVLIRAMICPNAHMREVCEVHRRSALASSVEGAAAERRGNTLEGFRERQGQNMAGKDLNAKAGIWPERQGQNMVKT